ncbi:hypothetical protein CA13_10420 [Planctomycetes bacterium CA13]|uniref:Uncharacterized protein n=1 Tax=Novipirellula herctigrandis TaxID=2527986 RepID=A0A5C5YX58_9BACT|nr:hypothetical protein CA13_10420 [Planctomycetes bacterium CA13]
MHTEDGVARLQMENHIAVPGDGRRSANDSRLPISQIMDLSDIDFASDTFFYFDPDSDWTQLSTTDSTLVIVVPKNLTRSIVMMEHVLANCFNDLVAKYYSGHGNWEGFRDLLCWPQLGFSRVVVVHLCPEFDWDSDPSMDSYLWAFYCYLRSDPEPEDRQWAVGFCTTTRLDIESKGYR